MAPTKDPFSESILKRIFRTYAPSPDRLVTRESNTIEFKENFHKGRELDRYGKTIAAFANNVGGHIIFGVTDKPRILNGMTNNKFIDLDQHTIAEYLNNKFAPEIEWEYYIHKIGHKKFGLLYVHESGGKPVIAKTNGGDAFKEGDIFYRYRGRSERIKYSELWQIIEKQRQTVHDTWFKHLSRISKIGVENAAIFNPEDGTVTGKGGQFIIDKSLLPKLRFIKKGEFQEITGEPAIRVVGDAEMLAIGDVRAERTRIETSKNRGVASSLLTA